jgi:hypothetical protein
MDAALDGRLIARESSFVCELVSSFIFIIVLGRRRVRARKKVGPRWSGQTISLAQVSRKTMT